jgi:translation initiation factor 2 alpha subunit (eIF-2alpha)
MKKKHLTAMPEDVAAARNDIGHVRATISQLLDDSDIAKGKTWKRLNKIYKALDDADRKLGQAQSLLEEALPKLLKQFEKKKGRGET